LILSEITNKSRTMVRTINSSLSLNEVVHKSRSMIRRVSESLHISQIIVKTDHLIKLVTEALSIAEFSGDRFIGLVRVINETLQFTETLKKIRWAIVRITRSARLNVSSNTAKLSKGSDTSKGDSR